LNRKKIAAALGLWKMLEFQPRKRDISLYFVNFSIILKLNFRNHNNSALEKFHQLRASFLSRNKKQAGEFLSEEIL
jgi:hypothetical protein